MQLALWAICLVVVVFLGVVFPIHMKHLNASGKIKYIHITMVLLGLVLPCVPVAVAFGTGGFSLRDIVFPPIICFGRDRGATVYSHSIVDSIIIATGVSPSDTCVLQVHQDKNSLIRSFEGFNIIAMY